MEKYIGKEIKGFKFSDGPGFVSEMEKYVGQTGKIISTYKNRFNVKFSDGRSWAYPYPEILKHLVEEEEISAFENDIYYVQFSTDGWWYPAREIEEQLAGPIVVEPELTLEETLKQIKNLIP